MWRVRSLSGQCSDENIGLSQQLLKRRVKAPLACAPLVPGKQHAHTQCAAEGSDRLTELAVADDA
jgi:hypothetical protein